MRILVVEDQAKMANFLKKGLNEVGYAVDIAESGTAAESYMAQGDYDLVILDVMLPDQNGIDTARHLRRDGYAGPILMVTALSTTKDKVNGLDAGADDYLTKPYSFDELHARVRALLRRKASNTGGAAITNVLKYADLELDLLQRKVRRSGQDISLTTKEFALLEYFMRNPERPLGRVSIAEHVWDIHFDSESNVIDVYINLLRKKIDAPFNKRLIHTVVGTGYVLKESP
ncbi:response regulator transcription factor [Bdellovibrio sp. SKB1291214]|uniref:response regulator transcription factor n=1 Tax=Bdellovibrio sp. SKB1291214 TaxID=1732569 RepID=UPI000B51C32F|nr:response regulator transcription factor [Bdellovibrio sp. SKB1291214]UYL09494.1 response regulator transcription factor [Bdellovibrio sp. SKB1291214]